MIRPNSKYLVMAAMIAFAANGNAGTTMVSPALAACSKALVESIASRAAAGLHGEGAGRLRLRSRGQELVHGARAQQEDQGAARQGFVQGDRRRRDRVLQGIAGEELKVSKAEELTIVD